MNRPGVPRVLGTLLAVWITDFRPRQSKEAARLVVDALADDPLAVYAVPDTERRRLPHLIHFRASLRMIMPAQAARVAVQDGRIIGLAFWGNVMANETYDPIDPRLARATGRLERRIGDAWPYSRRRARRAAPRVPERSRVTPEHPRGAPRPPGRRHRGCPAARRPRRGGPRRPTGLAGGDRPGGGPALPAARFRCHQDDRRAPAGSADPVEDAPARRERYAPPQRASWCLSCATHTTPSTPLPSPQHDAASELS